MKPTETAGIENKAVRGSVTANKTSISVMEGDITKHRSNVIVNSTDSRLSVKGGFLAYICVCTLW